MNLFYNNCDADTKTKRAWTKEMQMTKWLLLIYYCG